MNPTVKLLNEELKVARKELKEATQEKPCLFDEHSWCSKEQTIAVKRARVGTLIYIRGLIKKENLLSPNQ